MKNEIYVFDQNDPKWRNILIPNSNLLIGNYGCVICCIASWFNFQGINTDPRRLTSFLSFTNGLVLWRSIRNVDEKAQFIKKIENPYLEDIKNWLAIENQIIIKIKLKGRFGKLYDHWVIVFKKINDNDFLIGDSFFYKVINFKKFTETDQKIYAAVFLKFKK